MPLADLLGDKVRTGTGTEVSVPTVRAFFRACRVFGVEIGAVRRAASRVPGGLGVAAGVSPFLLTPDDGRLAYVLDGIAVGSPVDLRAAALAVATFVAPLAPQIEELLAPAGEAVELEVDPGVRLVLSVAERIGVDPLRVMDWPLGLFLDAWLSFREKKEEGHIGVMDAVLPETPQVPVVDGPTRAQV